MKVISLIYTVFAVVLVLGAFAEGFDSPFTKSDALTLLSALVCFFIYLDLCKQEK